VGDEGDGGGQENENGENRVKPPLLFIIFFSFILFMYSCSYLLF